MAASKADIIGWFRRGVAYGNERMVVWCDEYDWEDYPEFTNLTGDELKDSVAARHGKNMMRLMEVYDLTADLDEQMNQRRVYNY